MHLIVVYPLLALVVLLLTLAFFLAFIALFGPPFVPTPQKTVDEILKSLKLKKGIVFYDLGCGDGRVVRSAVKQHGVTGIGVDLNPFLVFCCRIVSWLQGLNGTIVQFYCASFFKINLSNAEIIYMYPVPMVIPKLVKKFEKECQKGTIVVSYCFEIKEWKQRLVEEALINRKSVFFYQL